jgi:predicted acetyltransferase
MNIRYRRPRDDEHRTFVRTFLDLMNQSMPDERIDEAKEHDELDRSWVADDSGSIVGTITGHSFEFTMPGGSTTPLAGLTLVSVIPTHRRRGILNRLMKKFDGDCRERGEAFSGLFASEAGIYGRYGFGAATRMAQYTVDVDRAKGLADLDLPGSIRWGRLTDNADEVFDIFERTRPLRAGEIVRPRHMFDGMIRRAGASDKPVFVAIHDGPDGADGYAAYRIENKWIDHTAQNELSIAELTGDGPTRIALWRFLLSLDMVRTVIDKNARVDEPIHDVLTDPRQVRMTGLYDQLQLRILDPKVALAARAYNCDGRLSIGVLDKTYELTVDDGKPSVKRIKADADLDLTPRGLAMAFLGDRSFRSLVQSGQAFTDPETALLADSMFSTSPAPQCLTLF